MLRAVTEEAEKIIKRPNKTSTHVVAKSSRRGRIKRAGTPMMLLSTLAAAEEILVAAEDVLREELRVERVVSVR